MMPASRMLADQATSRIARVVALSKDPSLALVCTAAEGLDAPAWCLPEDRFDLLMRLPRQNPRVGEDAVDATDELASRPCGQAGDPLGTIAVS